MSLDVDKMVAFLWDRDSADEVSDEDLADWVTLLFDDDDEDEYGGNRKKPLL